MQNHGQHFSHASWKNWKKMFPFSLKLSCCGLLLSEVVFPFYCYFSVWSCCLSKQRLYLRSRALDLMSRSALILKLIGSCLAFETFQESSLQHCNDRLLSMKLNLLESGFPKLCMTNWKVCFDTAPNLSTIHSFSTYSGCRKQFNFQTSVQTLQIHQNRGTQMICLPCYSNTFLLLLRCCRSLSK